MPHQCLKCGKVFEEGSAQLLKGCPDCRGNRFFFTKEPLDEKQRTEITKEAGRDINEAIMKLMGKEIEELAEKQGDWVKIKPKDIRKAMKKQLSDKKVAPEKKKDIDIIIDEDFRKAYIEKIESEIEQTDTPETIHIEQHGKYKIDIKGLLEEEPIIIQKDGSYTIHLPSIFKMLDKEK